MKPSLSLFRLPMAWAALLLLISMLTACGASSPPVTPSGPAVSISRADGAATLVRANGHSGALPDATTLSLGDAINTAPDQTVTLRLSDGSTLQLGPSSQLVLRLVREGDQHPLFRLLSGTVTGKALSNNFIVQAYKEAAIQFHMIQNDLTVLPHDLSSSFRLWFEDQVLNAYIEAGEVDVQSGTQQATLPLGWQAIAEPEKPLRIVQVLTATPSTDDVATATPIQIITIAPTNTPYSTSTLLPTDTDTATPTWTPTRRRVTLQPTATSTEKLATAVPTNTNAPPPPPPPKPPPKPTNPPPTQPPPTNPPPTQPPPPTNPPTRLPPTAEPPTPGG